MATGGVVEVLLFFSIIETYYLEVPSPIQLNLSINIVESKVGLESDVQFNAHNDLRLVHHGSTCSPLSTHTVKALKLKI